MLSFLRGDLKFEFHPGQPEPAFAVNLKALECIVSVPRNLAQRLANQPDVVYSKTARTFLRPKSQLTYVPGGRSDRKKGAPNTVYTRAFFIAKRALSTANKEALDRGKLVTNSYGIISVDTTQSLISPMHASCTPI